MVDTDLPSSGVREIARALEVAPSSAYQLLSTMEAASIVERDPATKRYTWTLEFFRLACRVAETQHPIYNAALPRCRDLAEQTREAVYLGLYDQHRRDFMYVEYIESLSPVNYVMPCYEWIHLYSGAGSMAILPFLPPDDLSTLTDEIVRRRRREGVDGTRKDLENKFAEIRDAGYVISIAQRVTGAVGIGSPILGSGDRVVGNVVLALPEERLARPDAHELGRKVARAAWAVSADLGASTRPTQLL